MIGKSEKILHGVKLAGVAAATSALSLVNKKAGKKYLLSTLGGMPGLTAKAAQILATKLDLDVKNIHENLDPMPLSLVKKCLDEEAKDLLEDIVSIDDNPKVASLGQVHKAILKTGESVAIKVQFPNVAKELDQQVDFLLSASDIGPQKKYGLDMKSYHSYFKAAFQKEVLYREEAKSQRKYYKNMKETPGFVVPKILDKYTKEKVLTQTYENGVSLETVKNYWPLEARRECANIVANGFLTSLFQHGFVQSDPHPGNWAFRTKSPSQDEKITRGHEVIQYDFGSMLKIDKNHRLILMQMIYAYREKINISPYDYLVALGFCEQKLAYIADKLPALIERFLEPFLTPRAYPMEEWDLANDFERILGADKWWFRTAGPPWFLMLLRAIQGAKHLLAQLGAPVPLGQIFAAITGDLKDLKVKVPARKKFLDGKTYKLEHCAKHLYVEVVEKASKKRVVYLTMPARSLDCLEELVPVEVAEKISEQHDLIAIKKKAQRSGYTKGELFFAQTDQRTYKVWLE